MELDKMSRHFSEEIARLNHSETSNRFILYPTLLHAEPSRMSLSTFYGKQVTVKTREPHLNLEGTLIHVDRSLKHNGFGNVILENGDDELIIVKGNFVEVVVLEGEESVQACGHFDSPKRKTPSGRGIAKALRSHAGPQNTSKTKGDREQ